MWPANEGSKSMETTITKTCSISGGDLPEGYKRSIDITFDMTGATESDRDGWAISHLVISAQRALKKMTTTELNELAKTGYKCRALDAGKRAVDVTAAYKGSFAGKTREDQLAEIEALTAIMDS